MSKCISMHGEYSEHDLPGTKFGEFDCNLCYAFDEDAAMAEVVRLRAKVARVEALADDLDKKSEAAYEQRFTEDWAYYEGRGDVYEEAERLIREAIDEPDTT